MPLVRSAPPRAESLESRTHLHAITDDHTPAPSRALVAVDAGGPGTIDEGGEMFNADRGFTGGQLISLPGAIAKTGDDALYATARQGLPGIADDHMLSPDKSSNAILRQGAKRSSDR